MISKFLIILVVVCWSVKGFPDGAPIDACVKTRPNQPNHGQHRSQPLATLPYRVTASSVNYSPGARITVTIGGGESFKGFFIQARSVETDEWLGSWEQAPNTTLHPECASITHADPRDKSRATFVWIAPNSHGRVYFTSHSVLLQDARIRRSWSRENARTRPRPILVNTNRPRGTVLKNYGTFWANIIAESPQDPATLQILG